MKNLIQNLINRLACILNGHQWGAFEWEKYIPEQTRHCSHCALVNIKHQRGTDRYFRDDANGSTWHEVKPLRKSGINPKS